MNWLRRLLGLRQAEDMRPVVNEEIEEARDVHRRALDRLNRALDERQRIDEEMARADAAMFGTRRENR